MKDLLHDLWRAFLSPLSNGVLVYAAVAAIGGITFLVVAGIYSLFAH